VAFQQATCLADNLLRAAAGEPLRAFNFQDLGEMMSLGRQDASLTGAGLTLAGRAAYELRRLAYLTRMPGGSHRLKVAAGWVAAWS
jgi:NADH dehydrogenase